MVETPETTAYATVSAAAGALAVEGVDREPERTLTPRS